VGEDIYIWLPLALEGNGSGVGSRVAELAPPSTALEVTNNIAVATHVLVFVRCITCRKGYLASDEFHLSLSCDRSRRRYHSHRLAALPRSPAWALCGLPHPVLGWLRVSFRSFFFALSYVPTCLFQRAHPPSSWTRLTLWLPANVESGLARVPKNLVL